jgi:3-hydroxy-9,10-secoandrosta-1,3,5(10)-triene-9,17-dione monooxygenase
MLDEYERLTRTKTTPLPPFVPRIKDPDYQRWFGRALTHIATAGRAQVTRVVGHAPTRRLRA